MEIAAIICENGLGHFKRTLGVLHEWNRRRPGDTLHVFAENWQRKRLADWDKIRLLDQAGVHFHAGFIAPGVRIREPHIYRDGRLTEWVQRLEGEPVIRRADLVLSDNLSGLLSLRPDTVLLGSFLWSDILEPLAAAQPAVADFVRSERALLAAHRPPMLCVGDIAMPGVLAKTEAVTLPWFAQDPPVPRTANFQGRIAILGGATGLMDQAIAELADRIRALPDWTLFLPPTNAREKAGTKPFGYGPMDYAGVDLVICRPGVGTVTDCIATQTPIVTISEGNNPEMDHNAQRLEALEVARRVIDPDDLLNTVRTVTSPPTYEKMVHRLGTLNTRGISGAVDWLTAHTLSN